MVQYPPVPQDDLMDVMEMTNKIEAHVLHILKENEMHISMSALMGSFINCFLVHCDTPESRIHYGFIFTQILVRSIEAINAKESE